MKSEISSLDIEHPSLSYKALWDPQTSKEDRVVDFPESINEKPGVSKHLLVINNEGWGFASNETEWLEQWCNLDHVEERWVVLKQNTGGEDTPEHLIKKMLELDANGCCGSKGTKAPLRDRLIIVTPIQVLRKTLAISREISWEQTLEQLIEEVDQEKSDSSFSRARAVVVTFAADAAVLLFRDKDSGASARLFFSPTIIEGEHERKYEGRMIAINAIFTAAIAYSLQAHLHANCAEEDLAKTLSSGIYAGLQASRALYREGLVENGTAKEIEAQDEDLVPKYRSTELPVLDYPLATIAEVIRGAQREFIKNEQPAKDQKAFRDSEPRSSSYSRPFKKTDEVPAYMPPKEGEVPFEAIKWFQLSRTVIDETGTQGWSILKERIRSSASGSTDLGSATERAALIAIRGYENALTDVPVGIFGKFATVDRKEIESFRNVRLLMDEYMKNEEIRHPLNIAVFGKPGTGKSYSLKELATSLPKSKLHELTFNLSQFQRPEALLDALHQVRDDALSGKIPLVFWDEFDTPLQGVPFGWLPYFLAPMQDGNFQQGQVTHWIGKAVFVFAGSKFESSSQMVLEPSEEPRLGSVASTHAMFLEQKGRDFQSRLRATIDILGPNPTTDSAVDDECVIRRGMLLRQLLFSKRQTLFSERIRTDKHGRQKRTHILQIDPGVLYAFLRTRKYYHNTRSVEAIMEAGTTYKKRKFSSSDLPAAALLKLHVSATEFLSFAKEPPTWFVKAVKIMTGEDDRKENAQSEGGEVGASST